MSRTEGLDEVDYIYNSKQNMCIIYKPFVNNVRLKQVAGKVIIFNCNNVFRIPGRGGNSRSKPFWIWVQNYLQM